jgi:hypothetical protein
VCCAARNGLARREQWQRQKSVVQYLCLSTCSYFLRRLKFAQLLLKGMKRFPLLLLSLRVLNPGKADVTRNREKQKKISNQSTPTNGYQEQRRKQRKAEGLYKKRNTYLSAMSESNTANNASKSGVWAAHEEILKKETIRIAKLETAIAPSIAGGTHLPPVRFRVRLFCASLPFCLIVHKWCVCNTVKWGLQPTDFIGRRRSSCTDEHR